MFEIQGIAPSILSVDTRTPLGLKMRDQAITLIINNILSNDQNLRTCAVLAMYNVCWSLTRLRDASNITLDENFSSELLAAICESIAVETDHTSPNEENG
jgi:hypothetical protein